MIRKTSIKALRPTLCLSIAFFCDRPEFNLRHALDVATRCFEKGLQKNNRLRKAGEAQAGPGRAISIWANITKH